MKVSDNHNIPLSVRILGLFFDPKLNWNEQIKTVLKKCKLRMYKLAKISYHKDFNLSPQCVWKLYLTTIRPIMEYGLNIYGNNSNNIDKLESLQDQAVRIALKQRINAEN